MTRTEMKQKAQEVLMAGLANQIGYWNPEENGEDWTPEEWEEISQIMKVQADRVAKMFGFEEAWSN